MVNLGTVEVILGEYWTKWLLRLVVTLVIAVVWDYWCRPPAAAKTQTPLRTTTNSNTSTVSGGTRHLSDLDFDALNELALVETVELVVKEKREVVVKEKEKEIIPATEKQESPPPSKQTEASNSDSNSNSRNIKEDKSQEKKRRDRPTKSTAVSSSPSLQRQPPSPPVFQATTDDHPGLQAFWNWCNVETSLFRIYTVGRTDHVPVVPPYNPSSRRGQVSVHLRVTNGTDTTIAVYWVNYKGREEHKGNIRPDAVWTQTTWMEHPWVFREAAAIGGGDGTTDEQQVLVHYIPYTILPTLPESPTVDPDDYTVGMHQFTIRPLETTATYPYSVLIDDPVLPFPAEHYLKTPTACISWTLMHCRRMMEAQLLDPSMYTTLVKYLTKIVQHPEICKYRQIRIANPVFHRLWQSPVRGLLLAVGFVECGAHLELGSSASSGSSDSSPLRRDRVQDVALLLFQVEQSQLLTLTDNMNANTNSAVTRQQPLGADGFGRAGWGRAGGMNVQD
jgi:hypothetical protein